MFAIVELGGKQYIVREKDTLRVEKMQTPAGKTEETAKVLLISDDKQTRVGAPYLPNSSVELKVKCTGLSKKVRTFKMKAKKRYKRLKGWRQPYSEVEVVKIKA